MFDQLFHEFKTGHLKYNDEPNFNDAKIQSCLRSAIAACESRVRRLIFIKHMSSFVSFNAGIAYLTPIPNNGEVQVGNVTHYCDNNGELRVARNFNGLLRCDWNSGFNTIEEIPHDIKQAIFNLGSHLFNHDGSAMNRNAIGGSARSADMINDPFRDSGAAALLAPYISYVS